MLLRERLLNQPEKRVQGPEMVRMPDLEHPKRESTAGGIGKMKAIGRGFFWRNLYNLRFV